MIDFNRKVFNHCSPLSTRNKSRSKKRKKIKGECALYDARGIIYSSAVKRTFIN